VRARRRGRACGCPRSAAPVDAVPTPRALTRGSGDDGVAPQKSHLGASPGMLAGSSLAARTSSDSLIETDTRVGTVNATAVFSQL
jgi:hypothetical protein